jgi:hypothetical protein
VDEDAGISVVGFQQFISILQPDYDGSQGSTSAVLVCCHTYVTVTKVSAAAARESLNFDGFGNSLHASFSVLRIGSD